MMTVNMCRTHHYYSFDLVSAEEAVDMSSSTGHMLIGFGTGHMHSCEFCIEHSCCRDGYVMQSAADI